MSIVKAVASKNNNKFVIPCAGKMFRSNVTTTNKALGFVLNKGYLQTDTIEEIENYKNLIKQGYDSVIYVGPPDKIRLRNEDKIVYRQRYFFKSFELLVQMCKFFCFEIIIDDEFEITINNVMNCQEDLQYLEIYAKKQDETITKYLTNTCLVHINDFLKVHNTYYKLPKNIDKFLEGKREYLERAPFLVVSYSIDKRESGIFIYNKYFKDTRKYNINIEHDVEKVNFGFTEENVKKDLKAGYFKL